MEALMEKVEIVHPDLPDKPVITVSRRSYEQVWKARGWRINRKKKETE